MSKEKFYVDGSGVVMASFDVTDSSKPVTPKASSDQKMTFNGQGIIPYGTNNDFPTALYEKARKSTIIPSTLERLVDMIYGGGIVFGKVVNKNGKETFEPLEDEKTVEKIRRTLRATNADAYIRGAALNFVWNKMIFPEIKLDTGHQNIVGVFNQKSKKVRWQVPDKDREIKNAVIHADWKSISEIKAAKFDGAQVLPVLDLRQIDPVSALKAKAEKEKKKHSYLLRLDIPDVDGEYYNTPNWYSAELSEWLDFSLQIPKYKNAMMKNQMSIKYIIYVDNQYWQARYKDWDKLSDSDRSKKKQTELKSFMDKMKGTDGAGGTIISQKIMDPTTRQEYKLWEVESIDDKLKDGSWIVDSAEASSHILFSLGLDPTITGHGPGKNFGSGSGSDKRVATNIQVSSLRWIQDLILKPFDLMRDFNKWPWETVFRMRNSIQTTLDQGSSAKESK